MMKVHCGSLMPYLAFPLLCLALVFAACAPSEAPTTEEEPTAETPTEEAAPEIASYTIRGQIEALPSEPGGKIRIHHEAIPDFEDREGNVTGMDAMSMGFDVAEGVSLDELGEGDKVEFVLEIDWDREPASLVTEVSPLPADTELDLGAEMEGMEETESEETE